MNASPRGILDHRATEAPDLGSGHPGTVAAALTVKQRTICDMIALGWSNKEIANSLGLGVRTVEDHRAVIFGKMGVRNAVELTRKVLGAA
jgi:DNA-binding NarL/FixJ family response regulator